MFKLLKKYFIPYEGNDHKPHFLRYEATVVMLGVVLFFELVFLFQSLVFIPQTNLFASILPPVLTQETNAGRLDNNLPILQVNPLLVAAAQLKANDMAANSYFSHNSPDGKTPWYWLKQVGYQYSYAGENLAVNFIDSKDVIVAWMNSPEHRANILSDKYSEIGIAAATGTYDGQETTFIVQFFGQPMATAAISAQPKTSVPASVPASVKSSPLTSSASLPTVAGQTTENIPALVKPSQPISSTSLAIVASRTTELQMTAIYNSPSLIAQILTQPRSLNTYIYLGLFALVTIALILTILIKIKVQHPVIILNGVMMLSIISLAYLVNYFVGLYAAQIF